jgi:hypothetical protein
MRIALELNHPAYDCLYLALALAHDTDFVTADEGFLRTVRQTRKVSFARSIISLSDAVAKLRTLRYRRRLRGHLQPSSNQ